MIERLFSQEEIVLYGKVFAISEDENAKVIDFLKAIYVRESLQYPSTPPFNESAAMWAAKTTYISAQLILYRQNDELELPSLLPPYPFEKTESAIFSADLCLRFLPQMMRHLILIDSADPLISLLQSILREWHYSGIDCMEIDPTNLDLQQVYANENLLQRYCERIIETRKDKWASLPRFNEVISGQFGIYQHEFWKEFKKIVPEQSV